MPGRGNQLVFRKVLLVNPSLERIIQPYRTIWAAGLDMRLRTVDRAQYKSRLGPVRLRH